jgi:hypothetical protein
LRQHRAHEVPQNRAHAQTSHESISETRNRSRKNNFFIDTDDSQGDRDNKLTSRREK